MKYTVNQSNESASLVKVNACFTQLVELFTLLYVVHVDSSGFQWALARPNWLAQCPVHWNPVQSAITYYMLILIMNTIKNVNIDY